MVMKQKFKVVTPDGVKVNNKAGERVRLEHGLTFTAVMVPENVLAREGTGPLKGFPTGRLVIGEVTDCDIAQGSARSLLNGQYAIPVGAPFEG